MLINGFKRVVSNESASIEYLLIMPIIIMAFVVVLLLPTMNFINNIRTTADNSSKNIAIDYNIVKQEEKVDKKEVVTTNQKIKPDTKVDPREVVIETPNSGSGISNFFKEFFVELSAGATLSILSFIIGKFSFKRSTRLDMNKTVKKE